jgi:hypothetical protein
MTRRAGVGAVLPSVGAGVGLGPPVAAPAPAALNRVIQPGLAEANAAVWSAAHVDDLRAAAAVGLLHDGPFQLLVHDEHDVVAARIAADEVFMAGVSRSAMSTASTGALVRQSAQTPPRLMGRLHKKGGGVAAGPGTGWAACAGRAPGKAYRPAGRGSRASHWPACGR